jgi:3',5'-cyclic AMP phosphodiesterase CpdA
MGRVFLVIGLLLPFFSSGQGFIRGPFLQSATQSSIIIKWRTSSLFAYELKIGEKADSLFSFKTAKSALDNEVLIDKLRPNTKYYYSISNKETGTVSAFFYTLPEKSSKQKMQFAIFGDCGTGTPKQLDVFSAVKNYFGDEKIDGMLLLGDNAYYYGFDKEYQEKFFPIYQSLLQKTVLWPTPGNHDYADRAWPNNLGEKPDYFNIFTLPTEGQSGGLASKTEAYYSYDVGNIHFVSLDSYGQVHGQRMSDLLSEQAKWLEADLKQNSQDWIVVYFHHPPFSKGSHDADKEPELTAIRTNLVPIFDKYNVDLVMTGHSHSYERSYLLKGFTETSASFSFSKHALSSSSGKYNGSANSCPYVKAKTGTVYMVAGTAGWTGKTTEGYPHKAMHYSTSSETGAVILEVENNRLEAKYLSSQGILLDNFIMLKDVNKNADYRISCGEVLSLKTSWQGDVFSKSNTSFSLDSLVLDTLFIVKDKNACLTDTFKIYVDPFSIPKASSNSPVLETQNLTLLSFFEGKGILDWLGPNNFSSKVTNPVLENIDERNSGTYKLAASYKSCISETQLDVEVIPLLGRRNERKNQTITVYPNPTNGQIKINITPPKTDKYQIELYTLSGQLRYSETVNLSENTINSLEINLTKLKDQNALILKVKNAFYSEDKLISIY